MTDGDAKPLRRDSFRPVRRARGRSGYHAGANICTEAAIFEPTHGSAPKYTVQDKVNPMALILSGILMLRPIQEKEAADRLERALAAVIAEGEYVSSDRKPHRDDPTAVGTCQMADAIIRELEKR